MGMGGRKIKTQSGMITQELSVPTLSIRTIGMALWYNTKDVVYAALMPASVGYSAMINNSTIHSQHYA